MSLHEAVDQHRADRIEEYRQTVWAKWDDANAKLSHSNEQKRRTRQRERAERKAAAKAVDVAASSAAFDLVCQDKVLARKLGVK